MNGNHYTCVVTMFSSWCSRDRTIIRCWHVTQI